MPFARHVIDFISARRKLLLPPFLTVAVIVVAIVLVSQGPKIVPFVYKLF
jgi:hypothetical protein